MRNITLSADDAVIDAARAVARSRQITLNQAFREWLQDFVAVKATGGGFRAAIAEIQKSGPRTVQPYTRDELHER